MHLLPVTAISLDDGGEAVDLQQPPGDIVVLSFADSDLGALAAAHRLRGGGPSLRLASLRRLRHPLSVDLYIDKTAAKSRFIVVRCLGGLDYWRYGLERLAETCRSQGIKLAVLPGDDRPDPRLSAYATVPQTVCGALEAYFQAGGIDNMGRLLACIGAEIGETGAFVEPPRAVPRAFAWMPQGFARSEVESHSTSPSSLWGGGFGGIAEPEAVLAGLSTERPPAYLLVYRSAVLAADTQAIEALWASLRERGIDPLILAVSSLKDPEAVAVVRRTIRARRPDVIVTTTAFSARDDADFVLDEAGCPILQAIPVGSARDAWEASPRGLSAADLAMQVALPEFDGRIAAGPISFKAEEPAEPALAFSSRVQAPDPVNIDAVADMAAAWVRLARTPRSERRLALVLSDYPARGGRAGFAVGLDTPASACAILDLLLDSGYGSRRDFSADELMPRLTEGEPSFEVPVSAYGAWLDTLPAEQRNAIDRRWGGIENDPCLQGGAFRFRAARAGNVLVALQPDRGHGLDRKGFYHDPECPPSHGYLAVYLGLRALEGIHALLHLGTHGTTEWLPGKAVALSSTCWPRLAIG